jgi:hypothetical protein
MGKGMVEIPPVTNAVEQDFIQMAMVLNVLVVFGEGAVERVLNGIN